MAKSKGSAKAQTVVKKMVKPKIKRKGIHSKKSISHLKTSKNYKKKYQGQGK
jgi:hypothetical protein